MGRHGDSTLQAFSDPGWLTSGFAMGVRASAAAPSGWRSHRTADRRAGRRSCWSATGDRDPRAKKAPTKSARCWPRTIACSATSSTSATSTTRAPRRGTQRNLLNLWRVTTVKTWVRSRSAGNHDMYYAATPTRHLPRRPALRPPGRVQSFALENDHWKLSDSTRLRGRRAEGRSGLLARDQISMRRAQGRPAHPPSLFSAHEPGAKRLGKRSSRCWPPTGSTPVRGHEHAASQYDATDGMGTGSFRLRLGHGGLPEFGDERSEVKPSPWAYEYLKPYGTADPWRPLASRCSNWTARR